MHPSLSVVPSDPSVKGSCVKTSGPLAAAAPHPQAPLPENSASLPGLLRPTTAENTSHAICLVLTIQLGGQTFSLLKRYNIKRKYNLKNISSSVSLFGKIVHIAMFQERHFLPPKSNLENTYTHKYPPELTLETTLGRSCNFREPFRKKVTKLRKAMERS